MYQYLFWGSLLASLCFDVGSVELDFEFNSNRNFVLLDCIDNNGMIAAETIFKFYRSSTTDSNPQMSVELPIPGATGNPLQYLHEVTPKTEAHITCTVEGIESEPVAIAAIPPIYEDVMVNVFRSPGVPAPLMCPIELGNLHRDLRPYDLSWELVSMFSEDVDLSSLSDENRVLSIDVSDHNDSRIFHCNLNLRRCNYMETNGINRCDAMVYPGPNMGLKVFELSRVIISPSQEEVTVGDKARFYCSASGSYVSVIWKYNTASELICSSTSCGHPASFNQSTVILNSDTQYLMINASLEIETSELSGNIPVKCIVKQTMPPTVGLNGNPDMPFATSLQINPNTPTPTTNTTTASPMPPSTTTATVTDGVKPGSPVSVTTVAVIIICVVVIILVLIVLVLVIAKFRCKRKKYSPSQSSVEEPSPPAYEELPERVFIFGTENRQPLLRQNGIECDNDNANPKGERLSYHGSEDRHSKSGGGSDVSGLSGVSGNIPGAHKMPTYSSHDNSVVSENFLAPPVWDKKCFSDGTIHSRQTQSTIIPPYYQPEPNFHSRSAADVSQDRVPFPVNRYASQGNINYSAAVSMNDNRLFFQVGDPRYPVPHYPPPIPLPHPSFSGGPSPLHSQASDISSVSSVRNQSDSKGSRHSSSHSHASQQPISQDVLRTVMNCLMHNEDCEILYCPCKQIQKHRYKYLHASSTPPQQRSSPDRKQKKTCASVSSSSTESDSDVQDSNKKKACMRLKLNNHLHPHYHITTRSHRVRRAGSACQNVEHHRRSRSLSDLTPITEIRETPTLQAGGAIKAGTPIRTDGISVDSESSHYCPTKEDLLSQKVVTPLCSPNPPLLREISLSSDNIPALCLNDCLLQLKTPSPRKHRGHSLADSKFTRSISIKPVLKPVREISNGTETDDSNTSSRSDSPTEVEAVKSSQSDADEGIECIHASNSIQTFNVPVNRGESSGYESVEGEANSIITSSTSFSKSNAYGSQVSNRSCSPFETETIVSCDGIVTKTTEC